MFHFYAPCKYQKPRDFWMFLGDVEVNQWPEIGKKLANRQTPGQSHLTSLWWLCCWFRIHSVHFSSDCMTDFERVILYEIQLKYHHRFPANIDLLNFSNRNIRQTCEMCSKLTLKTPEQRCSSILIFNFEHILHLFLVLLFWTLNMYLFNRFCLAMTKNVFIFYASLVKTYFCQRSQILA